MKTIATAVLTLSVSLSAMTSAHASVELEANDNSKLTNICIAATQSNTSELAKAMKAANISKRAVAETVACNDMPITEFVEQYGTDVVAMNNYITSGNYKKQFSRAISETVYSKNGEMLELVATNHSSTTKICIAATKENPKMLLKAIRRADLSRQEAIELVQCNNTDLVDFIAQYNGNAITVNDAITNGKYSKSLSANITK